MPTLFVPCSVLLLKGQLLGGSHKKGSYTIKMYKTGFVKEGRRVSDG